MADLVEPAHILFAGVRGCSTTAIRAVHGRAHMAGQAITCAIPPGDNLMVFAVVEAAQEGDALMVSDEGAAFGPVFGDTTRP